MKRKRTIEELKAKLTCKKRKICSLKNKIDEQETTIVNLQQEVIQKDLQIQQMETQIQKQITKEALHHFLHNILEIALSDEILVDVTLKQKSENSLIVLGRPPVQGSARKQMRHVTPFSFIKHLIKAYIKSSSSPENLLNRLSHSLKLFFQNDEGLCIKKSHYDQLQFNTDINKIKIETSKGTFYLISKQSLDAKKINTFSLTEKQTEKAIKKYPKQKNKVIEYAINYLQKAIIDENTYNIACETLIRFIFTLFNQKPYTAFPQEGNTLPYEIRLYGNPKDAEQGDERSDFEIITAREISQKIKRQENLKYRIRIVDNEGSKVSKTIAALKQIDNIIARYKFAKYKTGTEEGAKKFIQKDLEKYNQHFNTFLKLPNARSAYTKKIIKLCNEELNVDNFQYQLQNHIAKHLYIVFDLKPLEKTIFVPSTSSDLAEKSMYVFKGQNKAKYSIKMGKQYRESQKQKAQGYNKQVIFRNEEPNIDVLAEKTIDHVQISTTTFLSEEFSSLTQGFENNQSYPSIILQSFATLVASAYEIKEEKFMKALQKSKNWHNFLDEAESGDSTSIGSLKDFEKHDNEGAVSKIGDLIHNQPLEISDTV